MGAKDDDKTAFMAVFGELADGLVQDEIDDQQVKIAVEWIKRMIDYNVPHGKLNRGLAVVDGVRALKAAKNETVERRGAEAGDGGWMVHRVFAGVLLGRGRHHGRERDEKRAAVLVQAAGREDDGD